MKYNYGSFKSRLTLLQPSPQEFDELGGILPTTYKEVVTVNALKRDKSTTYKQVIGDYVTVDTAYFIVNNILSAYPITNEWRIKINNEVYLINHITVIEDQIPYMLEIEATKIGGIS